MNEQPQTQSHNFYLGVVGVIGVGFILYITRTFTIPLAIAILLSILFAPITDRLKKNHIPEVVANLLILSSVFVVLTLLGLLLYNAIVSIAEESDKYGARLALIIHECIVFIREQLDIDLEAELIYNPNDTFLHQFSPQTIFSLINTGLGSFIGYFSSFLTMMLFLLFILSSQQLLVSKICAFLSAQNVQNSNSLIDSIVEQVQSYLWWKTFISVGTGGAVWLVSWLMGLDFPILWGFIAFVLNYIPSIGPILASFPPILLSILQFYDNLGWAALISVLIIGIQFTSGNIIEPIIMGDRLNLNILTVLICLFVWGIIWGFAGMVLSVPLTAFLNILFYHSERYRKISDLISS